MTNYLISYRINEKDSFNPIMKIGQIGALELNYEFKTNNKKKEIQKYIEKQFKDISYDYEIMILSITNLDTI